MVRVKRKWFVICIVLILSLACSCSGSNNMQIKYLNQKSLDDQNLLKEVTIKIMIPSFYLEEEGKSSFLYSTIDRFISENNVSDVVVDVVPWEQIMHKYTSLYEVDESPDMVMMGEYGMRSNILKNRFFPLNDFIDPNVIDDWADTYVESISQDDKIYGYIRNSDVRVMFYNKALFRKAGLSESDIPKTWDQLIDVGIATNHIDGEDQYGLGIVGANTMHTPIMWSVLVFQQGKNITDANGRAIYDSEEGIKAAQLYSDFINKYQITPQRVLVSDDKTLTTDFSEGRYAMMLNGSWAYNEIIESKNMEPENIGWFQIPIPEGGSASTVSGFWSFCISSKTKYPELTYKLLNMIANEDTIKQEFLNGDIWIPTRESWVELPAVTQNPMIKDWTNYSDQFSYPAIVSGSPIELYEGLAKTLHDIMNGKDAKEALEKSADYYNSHYK